MPRADRHGGFTLIEVIVVLVVLGLVGALVLTRGPQRSGAVDLREGATHLVATLRLARARAIAGNRPLDVTFEPGRSAIQVAGQPAQVLRGGLRMIGEPQAIRFRPDGSSSGGVVQLAGGAHAARIEVDWLTGRVSFAEPR